MNFYKKNCWKNASKIVCSRHQELITIINGHSNLIRSELFSSRTCSYFKEPWHSLQLCFGFGPQTHLSNMIQLNQSPVTHPRQKHLMRPDESDSRKVQGYCGANQLFIIKNSVCQLKNTCLYNNYCTIITTNKTIIDELILCVLNVSNNIEGSFLVFPPPHSELPPPPPTKL